MAWKTGGIEKTKIKSEINSLSGGRRVGVRRGFKKITEQGGRVGVVSD